MKKVLLTAVLLLATAFVQAADYYVPTGVMAVYPGVVNEPFSSPINPLLRYDKKSDCEEDLVGMAKAPVIYVSTDNGTQRDQQTAAGSIVVVAGTCAKQTE